MLKHKDWDFEMNKEELIQLHTLMVLVKDFLEKRGQGEFSKYNSLNISPTHIHRNKYEHKNAIFILGKEIVSSISDDPNIIVDYSIGQIIDRYLQPTSATKT